MDSYGRLERDGGRYAEPPDTALHKLMLPAEQGLVSFRNSARDCDTPVSLSEDAAEVLDHIRRTIEQSPEVAHAAALRLVTLLTPTARTEPACARGGLAPWQKRKVDRYLREHLGGVLSVRTLADLIPLSLSHFCRAFKESFGQTPHMYIVQLRLQLAQKLMLTTQDPLSQIALECGMSDQAHLSKLFRRGLGETPSAWRRRNRTETLVDPRHSSSTPRSFVRSHCVAM